VTGEMWSACADVAPLPCALSRQRIPGRRARRLCRSKGLEIADRQIFAIGEIVSGHTLKHLAAAGGVACLIGMLRARAPFEPRAAVDPALVVGVRS
jgi:hypothetical protein